MLSSQRFTRSARSSSSSSLSPAPVPEIVIVPPRMPPPRRSAFPALFVPAVLLLFGYAVYLSATIFNWRGLPVVEERAATSQKSASVLAFYFPQFYEVEENNRFWGANFTDLVNVKRVRSNRFGQPVIRPRDRNGVAMWAYNQAWESHRRYQAELAKMYGVDGFAIMHYWFDDHPVMDAPLKGRLQDGQPAVPYCIFWANDHWTRQLDGLGGSEMLLQQMHKESTWLQHLQYLLPFFNDPSYIKVDGKPMFIVSRASDIPAFPRMLATWDAYLKTSTQLPGLHVIQTMGSKLTEVSHSLAPGVSGFVEYYPNLFNGARWPVSKMLSTHKSSLPAHHYHGVASAWDDTPHHLSDGKETVFVNHPSVFQYALQQNLARTQPGGFVFVNAWNKWGEGAAIEPSVEWGCRWLEAVKQAKENVRLGHVLRLNSRGQPVQLRLPPAGVPKASSSKPSTGCIIVRTFEGHETAMYNIHLFISTLFALNNKAWQAFFVNTDNRPYANLQTIVRSYGDARLQYVPPPAGMDLTYNPRVSAYDLVDRVVSTQCDTSKHDWMLITNADNWYTPDALDYMPDGFDLVLMNFYGRYNAINDLRFSNGSALDACCERLYPAAAAAADAPCFYAAPKIGFTDLGATLFNLHKYKAANTSFLQFNGACGEYSCHDGAMVQSLVADHHWTYTSHSLGVCAFYHNANPQSCSILGGVYYDSLDYGQAGCYDLTALPLEPADIKWEAFVKSKSACVCQRYEQFSQLFRDP